MKRFYLLLLSLFLFSATGSAQTPTPTATPIEDNDVVKISTTLIQVDVTVTGKDGKIVTNLKPEDFEIYENGKKQEITNFSFISNAPDVKAPQPANKSAGKNAVGVPIPPVNIRPEQVRRTIALVVDDLGLSFQSMVPVRLALKRFIDEQMQPNDLVAIIRTGSGIGALQQFTSDKNMLYAAIDRIRWNGMGRSGISPFAPIEQNTASQEPSEDSTSDTSSDVDTNAEADAYRDEILSTGTLGAINYIVRGMKELPGRKSVILFSDGFAICTAPTDEDAANNDDDNRCKRMTDATKYLTDSANRASVTIYSVDAKGLAYTGPTAGDSVGASATSMMSAMTTRSNQNLDQQEGLRFLAKETGGIAFLNSNDYTGSVNQALEDQKGFYLIAYSPEAESFDATKRRFNKLEVKVKQPGAYVRYRSGFFGVEDNNNHPDVAKQTPAQQLFAAISSPFATNGINLKLNTFFGVDKQKAPFIQSFLYIDAKNLKFTDEPDGWKKAVIDVIAMSFGDDGTPVDQIDKTHTLTVKGETYQRMLKEGFIYNFAFPIKTPGAYQMRVAVRDAGNSQVGSANQFIEVPDLKKGKLTLSGIILQNLTLDQWKNAAAKMPLPTTENKANEIDQKRNPMADTSVRQFKSGTILRYAVDVYNAKIDKIKTPQLQSQIRIYRDGKLALNGPTKPLNLNGQTDFQSIHFGGALNLGKELPKGDYVLQIIVIDNQVKGKNRVSTQWIQFEIVD